MLEVAEADLELGFVHAKAPQACRKSLAERVDANDWAFRASRWRRGSLARARMHRAHRRGGPRVRIPFPPAGSQLRTGLPPLPGTSRKNAVLYGGPRVRILLPPARSRCEPDFRGRIPSMTVGDFTQASAAQLAADFRRPVAARMAATPVATGHAHPGLACEILGVP
jgi:hypothetical protein